jgi:sugar O-acyltransferase (sialic acid O-acetyltransferase NeuD family)
VVIEVASLLEYKISGYLEKQPSKLNPYELDYFGFEGASDFEGWGKKYGFILGIGDNKIRAKLTELLNEKEESMLTIIHPNSDISQSAKIGEGTFISSGVQINAQTNIGKAVIINTGAIVEHECKIDDCVHVAPGAVLAGNVSIGTQSFVGANAVIKEGIKIGSNVTIGAGTVVLDDVENDQTVIGNPGRVYETR